MAAAASPSAMLRSPSRADDRAGFGTVFQELSRGVQLQPALGKIAEEGRVLIHDPDHLEPLAARTLGQRQALRLGERPVGAGDRVAVRIDRGIAEEGLDPVDQPLRGRVLHVLGLFVHLVPRHLERVGQEELEQAMPANHLQRQPLARRRSAAPLRRGCRWPGSASESVLSMPVTVPGETRSAWASSPVPTAVPAGLRAAISAIVLT